MVLRPRRVVAAAMGIPLAAVALLAAEVQLARRGERLPDKTFRYPASGSVTAVWLGDSTAVGVGGSSGDEAVASLVARERGERVVMLAASGATVADVVEVQLERVAAEDPDVVYLSVGANDVTHLTSEREFRRSYERTLRRLLELPGVAIVALGVPDMGATRRFLQPLRTLAGLRGRQLDRVIREVVGAHPKVDYIDIAGPTGPPFRRHPRRFFSADRYHPSGDGYRLWAEAVLDAPGP